MVRRSLLALGLALALAAGACTGGTTGTGPDDAGSPAGVGAPAPDRLTVEALSTRPELVTGGDVLVAVAAPAGADLGQVRLTRDGTDVTGALRPDGGRLVGLVEGLQRGPNLLRATLGDEAAELEVVDHPTTGPLFSGPLAEPFLCTTERNGLGPPTDADCSAPTTRTSREVAPGVRATVERGVLGRGVYALAVPEQGWNGRLVYRFGGGCGAGRTQGAGAPEAADPDLLGLGYAVASNTLTTFETACNDVLAAEVALITKERFAEAFGPPALTIGEGGSGGAIQQLLVAQGYPGIIDGVAAAMPFPDALSIAAGVSDCGLLQRWYQTPAGAALSPEQRRAVNGHASPLTCALWDRAFVPLLSATASCDGAVPAADRYDPVANPGGVRCGLVDSNANQLGRDPATGAVQRPLDNVGVQYGLGALLGGAIDGESFVALNEGIGGWDGDGVPVAARTEASEAALRAAYAGGRVTAGGGLADVPVVLVDAYTDRLGDIHDRQRAFAVRDRLARPGTGVDPANVVIWTRPGGADLLGLLTGGGSPPLVDAVTLLDRWLTAAAGEEGGTRTEQLARARPAEAVDTCVLPGGEVRSGPGTYAGDGDCARAYPVAADPRQVAGGPRAGDVLKCALAPLDEAAYGGRLSPSQLARLRAVFPDGVCDWSAPGVGQVPLDGTWRSYR